jgi:hypothetical protein
VLYSQLTLRAHEFGPNFCVRCFVQLLHPRLESGSQPDNFAHTCSSSNDDVLFDGDSSTGCPTVYADGLRHLAESANLEAEFDAKEIVLV